MWLSVALLLFVALQSDFSSQGLRALDEKRYPDAVDAFTRAVAAEPGDFSAHFNLALAYSLIGKDAEAVSEYKKTLELKPGLYQGELNLGMLLLRQKQAADSLPHLQTAASQKPKDYRPNFYAAEALLATGDFPKAEQSYQTALAADPKSAAGELGLARALARQNRLPDAAPHFRKAAELDAAFHDALLELASLYEDAKQPADAIALYQQFPDDAGAQEHLGQLLLSSGKTAEAVQHFEASVAKSPTVANRAALASAYLQDKQPGKALPLIQQALEAQPSDYELRMIQARILRDQRKFPEASQQFLAAVKIKPESAEAWSDLASTLVLAEQYQSAISALDRVRALHAEKPAHFYLRAIVLDRLKVLKPALESYRQFLAASQGHPDEEFKARQRARIIETELNKR